MYYYYINDYQKLIYHFFTYLPFWGVKKALKSTFLAYSVSSTVLLIILIASIQQIARLIQLYYIVDLCPLTNTSPLAPFPVPGSMSLTLYIYFIYKYINEIIQYLSLSDYLIIQLFLILFMLTVWSNSKISLK